MFTTHSNLYIFISALAWQYFVRRFTNFFVTFFVKGECLAEWEKFLSNGFLYTDANNLFYDLDLSRISMPSGKWVKIRDKFGVSCV